ncbi:MAG: ATP-binding protein [Candidatus Poribacteria bacterium]
MRLEWKYTLLINVFILLTMSAYFWFNDRMLEKEIANAVIRDHSRGASMRDIASDIQRRIAGKEDANELTRIIRSLSLHKMGWDIVDIVITDYNGVIISTLTGYDIYDQLSDEEIKRIASGQMRIRYPPEGYHGRWVIEFILPYVISYEPEENPKLGGLKIIFSTQEVVGYIRQIRLKNLFYTALVTVALTIFINPVTSYLIVRRIERLIETTTAAQSGDFAVRIRDRSRDEIGRLSRSINRMIEHISSEHDKRLKSLGNLAAGVAHEIRNPLNSMAITIQYLKDIIGEVSEDKSKDQSLKTDAQECLDIMSYQVKELDRIVEEFLQLSRPMSINLKITNLNDFIKNFVPNFSSNFEVNGIKLICSYSSNPVFIRIDKDKFGQAISNIVINAVQAMPNGGELYITIREDSEANKAVIEIRDTGIGISQENIDRLFEPYFTTKPDGLGLGLAITHRIIEAHNGEIKVNSEEGQGSTFRILLPVVDILHERIGSFGGGIE